LWPVKKSAEDDALEDAVRQGLRDAVAKHGSGDQSPHGNWARGGGQQTPRQRAWERHLTAPTPEERRRAGEDYVRYADAEDAAAVEGSGRASASDDRPLHEYAVGDKVEITYSRRDDPRELTATGQIRELERKSKFRYADHLVADLDDGGTIRFDDGRSNDIDLWSISRVSKHGSGDQSPHGNWARSKELGMVSIPDDDDSPARPEDEERDEELRRSRRTHTTRDGVAIEGQPKVQHIKNSEMFASGDGRVQLNYGEWKWTSAGQSRGVAKPPKLHERGHWGVWPRGADRSDTSKVIWGNGKTLAEFINSLDPGEYDLAT